MNDEITKLVLGAHDETQAFLQTIPGPGWALAPNRATFFKHSLPALETRWHWIPYDAFAIVDALRRAIREKTQADECFLEAVCDDFYQAGVKYRGDGGQAFASGRGATALAAAIRLVDDCASRMYLD